MASGRERNGLDVNSPSVSISQTNGDGTSKENEQSENTDYSSNVEKSPKSPKSPKSMSPKPPESPNSHKSPKSKSPKSPGGLDSSPEADGKSPDDGFEHLDQEDATRENTFAELMQKMHLKHYDISHDEEALIYGKCKFLFERDYACKVVHNSNLAMNYPIGIIVPVSKKEDIEGSAMDFDDALYSELVKEAHEARLRNRFVVPVILFDNKFICRSGTLTVKLAAIYTSITKPAPPQTTYFEDGPGTLRSLTDGVLTLGSYVCRNVSSITDWNGMHSKIMKDVEVLKHLKVKRICDLMVEYAKNYRQILNVSSTEKEHEDLYGEIKMEEMPYPGCEFFAAYHEAGRNPTDLFFDWKQSDVTRELKLTEDPRTFFPEIKVGEFKEWPLIQLTQNYLKIILSYLVIDEGGMVVHCISGWDRTPLFVCLLRLSLWADGVVHKNLDLKDIAYLTVAYDWFLSGHNLPNRLQKNEEVMHFCFNFLEHITSDEFSVTRLFQELPAEKKRNRAFPEFVPERRLVLNEMRDFLLRLYNEYIIADDADDDVAD